MSTSSGDSHDLESAGDSFWRDISIFYPKYQSYT